MAAIRFHCPKCRKHFEVGGKYAGRRINCPFCGVMIRIPGVAAPVAVVRQAAAPVASEPRSAPRPQQVAVREPPVEPESTPPAHDFAPLLPPKKPDYVGIAAVSFGSLGLVLFERPTLGVPLAVIGLLLGMGALVAALRRGENKPFFALGGGAASLLGLLLGIGAAFGLLPGFGGGEEKVRAAAVAKLEEHLKQERVKETWKDAPHASVSVESEPDITVEVTKTTIAPVAFTRLGEKETSPESYLQIEIGVTNRSASRKIEFTGWSEVFQPMLKDDLENGYKKIELGSNARVEGQSETVSIYPQKRVIDVLLFEPPVEGAHELYLELPAGNFGAAGNLRFKIPRSMWLPAK